MGKDRDEKLCKVTGDRLKGSQGDLGSDSSIIDIKLDILEPTYYWLII